MNGDFVNGQRWVSLSEPELGLGEVRGWGAGRVELEFGAVEEVKVYALATAPILRVKFKVGDEVVVRNGERVAVEGVEDRDGLMFYVGGGREFGEEELDAGMSFSKPEERLLAGMVDDLWTCDLRVQSLFRWSEVRGARVRGMLGGRVDLIPHQLAIVEEVCSRRSPRVLLADEVGLGKTIEACLIMHRLHLTGRADRVLILLPESLVHQWFVELFRRFNMMFSIYDEERCGGDREGNVFLESQLVICSIDFLVSRGELVGDVLEADWDLLIVDEAHHLESSEGEGGSVEYELVEGLAEEVKSLLLLSATPQQLGVEGHFARLRLLDSARYGDLEEFVKESRSYEEVAEALEVIEGGGVPEVGLFAEKSKRVEEGLTRLDEEGMREKLIGWMLDGFGTGRVMFRNTRKHLGGFPERRGHLVRLEGEDVFLAKVSWLVEFLKKNQSQKVLLICRELELVEELAEAILDRIDLKLGVFHEELTLIQRDRNAAYFSEKDGAQILLCSEIGSEGRNFQFAQHLVLFDLPGNPELLEQRIGRLDRIGQQGTIHIYVPYVVGDRGERYARWYDEGLDAFERNLPGGAMLVERLQKVDKQSLDEFIVESKRLRDELEGEMESGSFIGKDVKGAW